MLSTQLRKNETYEGIHIQGQHLKVTSVYNAEFKSRNVKSLVVYFGKDKNKYMNLSWNEKIEKCIKLINNWNKRKITFFGKITVIIYILFQKLVYLAQGIVTPDSIIKIVNSMIFLISLEWLKR